MKLAAGKETLEKCPDASEEAHAALGAASAPPIRGVAVGKGDRAVTAGEETVFFRHEKTFARPTPLFRNLDPSGYSEEELAALLDEWAGINIERAGEVFRVDGVAIVEPVAGDAGRMGAAAAAVSARGLPAAVLAATPGGARAALEKLPGDQPLLVPPRDADIAPYQALAKEFNTALTVSGATLEETAAAAVAAAGAGIDNIFLEPPGADPRELHCNLTLIRRGALERIHPGLAYPVFLRIERDDFERGVTGITKFASLLAVEDTGGESWLPFWTLRQNIYTDPQKPLQIDPGIYPVGEPGPGSPLLVTTNFSLTYFIVSTELDGAGVPCHLAVVDAEGMSVLTAWSAGKFSGETVGKELLKMGAADLVDHNTVITPGLVAVISGELEDTLGESWKVVVGPQEASDLGPFFKDLQQG